MVLEHADLPGHDDELADRVGENNLDALVWQLNDIWQGASWTSVEHSDRWKVLQYAMSSVYQSAVINAFWTSTNKSLEIIVNSNRWDAVRGAVQWMCFDWEGHTLSTTRKSFVVPDLNNSVLFQAQDLRDILPSEKSTEDVWLWMNATAEVDSRTVMNEQFFTPTSLAKANLVDPRIKITHRENLAFTLSAKGSIAAWTWMDHLSGTVGYFFDGMTGVPTNGFYLVPGMDRKAAEPGSGWENSGIKHCLWSLLVLHMFFPPGVSALDEPSLDVGDKPLSFTPWVTWHHFCSGLPDLTPYKRIAEISPVPIAAPSAILIHWHMIPSNTLLLSTSQGIAPAAGLANYLSRRALLAGMRTPVQLVMHLLIAAVSHGTPGSTPSNSPDPDWHRDRGLFWIRPIYVGAIDSSTPNWRLFFQMVAFSTQTRHLLPFRKLDRGFYHRGDFICVAMMSIQFAGGLFACCVGWLAWRLVSQRIKQVHLRNIPGPPSASFWTGNIGQVFAPDGWKFHADIAANYGRVVRLNGMLGDTELYISDTRALHNILVKDQHIFEESSRSIAQNQTFFGPSVVSTLGDHHKRQRKLLSPVFSNGHMRHLMPIFYQITQQLRETLIAKVEDGPKEVDMMDWMTRAALELVGQAGLGYSFDTLDDKVENTYANATKNFLPTVNSPSMIIALEFLPWLMRIGTSAFRRAVAEKTPWEDVQRLINVLDIMDKTSREIFENKKIALEKGDQAVVHQIGEGKDIISVLMKANMAVSAEDRIPEKELLAQMSTLIFAAMDTTSSALSRTLSLLSERQDIQDKLRAELMDAREMSNDRDFDSLHALPYLEAVCRETLRFTRKDVVLALGTPITGVDGTKISEIMIPNNTGIYVSILAVNRDPGIWGDDAMEWKPERWLSPLPPSVAEARIPGVYANTYVLLPNFGFY
ncbi:hypothetical protein EW146_g9889 [Bondarzewia mesenterica]|uniref:Mannosidase Ig/CBM-like domain-containing protein n=1 Tax=Bondarzewia mesenterica TaxID=1095465 RepID=A0A4S4L2E7_9AGAM|nr:hypothetical protein EW146_g9889 [Bondarzewia mesenterica]